MNNWETEGLYKIECSGAQKASLKSWFGKALKDDAPDGLILNLTERQVHGLNRDHGITAIPLPR
jgi:hypothetical protein